MTARLPLRFAVYAPSGAQMLATLRPTAYSLQLVASRATQSALTISARAADEAAHLLSSPCEIGVQVANRSGVWSDVPNGRFCVMSAALDRTTGSSAILTATTLSLAAYRLGGVLFVPSTNRTPQTLTGTPGAIWHTLVSEAQGRGLLTGLSVDTSATVDGTGIAWSAGSKSLKLDAGMSYADILDTLINNGWADATFSGLSMSMVNHVAPSANQPTAFLHVGRAGGLATAPTTTDWSGLATGAVVVGSDGVTVAHAASSALTATAWDGYETLVNSSTTSTPSALQTAGAQYLGTRSTESLTSTADLTLDPSGPLPLLDYALGDYVSVLSTGDTRRVEQLDVSAGSGSGLAGTLTFNARSVSVGRSLAKQVARVSAAARVAPSADVGLSPRQVILVSSAVTQTSVPRGTLTVNAADYGVVADWNGTTGTDNGGYLANAVATVSAGFTRGVYLPAGNYYFASFPALPADCVLYGDGPATTITVNSNMNVIANASGANNITIRDLAVVNAATSTTTTAALIILTGDGHRVANCRLNGGKLGVCFNGATNSTAAGNEIWGQNGTATPVGVYLTGTTSAFATGCKVLGNHVHDMSGVGIFGFCTVTGDVKLDAKIDNNTVSTVTDNGIRVQTTAGYIQGTYSITNNTVINPSVNCIRLNGVDATCSGNRTYGGTAGIRDGGGTGGTWVEQSTIANNTVVGPGTTGAGIQLQNGSNRCSITGNVVTGWNYGVYIGDTTVAGLGPATGHALTGNISYGNYRDGFLFTAGTTRCTVSGNTAKNNGQAGSGPAGFAVDTGCSHFTFTGNHGYDDQPTKTQTNGFRMVGTADFCLVIGNDWRGNNAAAIYLGANTVHNGNYDFSGYDGPFNASVASTANLNLTTTATAVPGAALTLPASTGSFLVTGVMDLGSGSAGYGVGQLYVAGVAQASQVIVEYTAGRATQSQTWIIPGTTGTQTLALYCSATSGTGWVCRSPHTTITAVEIK